MKRALLTCLIALLALACGPNLQADSLPYTGTLKAQDSGPNGPGLTANGAWNNQFTSVGWSVNKYSVNSSYWTYEYSLNVGNQGGISHFIIELSDTFTTENVKVGPHVGPAETLGDNLVYELGSFDSGVANNNPGLPSSIYGLKIDLPDRPEVLQYQFWFASDRDPVWGDIYAKDGVAGGQGLNYLFNVGFGTPDPNELPSLPFTDPKVYGHILRPDSTGGGTQVPHPGALVGLLSMGAIGLVRRSLRRRR